MSSDIERIQNLLNSVWPEWRIVKRLGKGSYGSVYEIIRDDLGSSYRCSLKVLEMEVEDPAFPEERTVQVLRNSSFFAGRLYPQSADKGPEDGSGDSPQGRDLSPRQKLSADHTGPSGLQGLYAETETDILEEFVRGVSNEIDLMMQLKGSPNIVAIEDYVVLRGRSIRTILIRTELLQSIAAISESSHGMDRRDVILLGMDICTALSRCEEKSILHRDIKPGNLFYSENAGYKLGDFGISRTMESIHEKMSMTGVGTVQYMAPEVYYGGRYDNTVDIYSLGLSLYTLLNENLPPFYEIASRNGTGSGGSGSRREANLRRLRGEPLPPPRSADDHLARVILKACAPKPEDRFRTASEFRDALSDCLQESFPVPAAPKAAPRLPRRALPALAVLLVLAAALFFIFRSAGKREPAEVLYRIICQDEEGNLLEEQELQGTAGETVLYSASDLDGYTLKEKTQSLVLSEEPDRNVLTFTYEVIPEAQASAAPAPVEDTLPAEAEALPDMVEWTDTNLENAVKESLGISGDLTPQEAAAVQELILDASDITDLSGLEHFTGLETLSLADNFIEDLSPLAGLTGLHKLNLEKNKVKDLTPLRNLTALRRLDLFQNRVSDLTPLKDLTKLTMLDVRENDISDLGPCAGMVSMVDLYLSTNKNIRDISALSGMTSLQYLGLKNTQVEDLSPLEKADALLKLILANTEVKTLAPVKDLPNLLFLDIRGCALEDTRALEELRHKSDLEISR